MSCYVINDSFNSSNGSGAICQNSCGRRTPNLTYANQFSIIMPSKFIKSVTFAVTIINPLIAAMAAICPSTNAGDNPAQLNRARS